ncbi:NB-ARC domain-containing protein [Actinokineospora fastidiosa]|uniref:NB-ARC domain-containing protein n=1 Tax=Actinokineospora fastidiosa TaxID=1816 RepID=A0A918LG50_9PSEU|nr:NB-ARC domain-containing protein [Actinokineospora fastidiosa]GGS42689.1 hypothetical protein GCM10010171_42130 [Actinokineospora fastidiosa]
MTARRQAVAAAAATTVSVLVAVMVNLLTSGWSWLIFLGLAALSLAWVGLEVWRSTPGRESRTALGAPAEVAAVDGFVPRPELTGGIVRALLAGGRRKVGITTALAGAGGFGKTTLAAQVCELPEIKAAFPSIYWVTVGQEVRGAALADTVNDVIERVARRRSGLTSPEQAGLQLGELLAERGPSLLVVDDVWTAEQLRPFLNAGRGCTLMVTTRIPDLLPDSADTATIRVDQMSRVQATELLGSGLGGLPAHVGERLLDITGRWPLALRLANAALRRTARDGGDIAEAAERLLRRLGELGPAALDVTDTARRERTVAATLESSLSVLGANRDRALELAIFPEDVEVPQDLVAHLWKATADLARDESDRLCRELVELSLVTQHGPRLRLHDVIRTYLRHECGGLRLARLNESLLTEVASTLPDPVSGQVPWWCLPRSADYLWRSLAYHLDSAGRAEELAALATAPPWVITKLRRFGPVAVAEDLAFVDTESAVELGRFLDQLGHLLVPTEPDHAVVNALAQRLPASPALDKLRRAALAAVDGVPRLVPQRALPDLPDPALNRVLVGHEDIVEGCVYAPDGSWLATVAADGVRVWDPETGRLLRILEGSARDLLEEGFALSPDGRLLACAADAHTVDVWDTSTWRLRYTLTGHRTPLNCCCFSADGTTLLTADYYRQARLWDVATGGLIRVIKTDPAVESCAALPDGRLLAVDGDGVKVWDPRAAVGAAMPLPSGFTCEAVAVSPDGRWAAAPGDVGVLIWDLTAMGEPPRMLHHHRDLTVAVFSPDGGTLAVGGENGLIVLWDTVAWRQAGAIAAHGAEVTDLAFAPDGSVLASTAKDRTVRLWNPGRARVDVEHREVPDALGECAAAPDGSWFAVGTGDVVEIHDPAGGGVRERIRYPGRLFDLTPVGADLLLIQDFDRFLLCRTDDWRSARPLLHPADLLRYPLGVGGALVCGVDTQGWVVVWDTTTWTPPVFLEATESGVRVHREWADRTDQLANRLRRVAGRTPKQDNSAEAAISPHGEWLAVRRARTVHVLAPGDWAPLAAIRVDHEVDAMDVTPDGAHLLLTGPDGDRWWDTRTWTESEAPPRFPSKVMDDRWSPNGRLVASVSERVLRIRDAGDWSPLTEIRLDGEVTGCAWLTDERLAVIGGHGIFWFAYVPGESDPATVSPTVDAGVAR